MQPAIKDHYHLTRVLLSNEQQDVVLCRKTSSKANSLQKYIINIYKNKNAIRTILPDLSDFERKYTGQYIEHYIKDSSLHIVLRHSLPHDSILIGKDLPLKDRMEITDNLFIHILKLNELKPVHLYSLLSPENIAIGTDRSVYLSNVLAFPDNMEQITSRAIAVQIGAIMLKFFSDMKRLPEPLSDLIRNCCDGSYDSAAQAYTAFKSIKRRFDEMDYDFKKGKKLFGIILIPFSPGLQESRDKSGIPKKAAFPLVLLVFLLTCSGLFVYDRYFKIDAPVMAQAEIQLKEPEKPVKVYEEKQPELPPVQYYTVQAGDSLSYISRKFYNDPNKYQIIADYNRLPDPDRLEIGQILEIP